MTWRTTYSFTKMTARMQAMTEYDEPYGDHNYHDLDLWISEGNVWRGQRGYGSKYDWTEVCSPPVQHMYQRWLARSIVA